jgi:DNA-binding GntR family transcriptional regulator
MNLKNKTYLKIRDQIVLGEFAPKERLTEVKLSKELGCSRGPVREALTQLEKESFVTLVPNQGAIVNQISSREIKDYYALLEILEGKAVEWAVPRLVQEDIDRLSKINSSLKNLSRDDKDLVESWISLNLAFHSLFREKCGNEKLNWIIGEIRLRITRYRYSSLFINAFDQYIEDHENILSAVRQRDAARASQAMGKHILRAKDVLMQFLSHMQI